METTNLVFLQAASPSGLNLPLIFLMIGVFLVIQFVIMGPRQKKKEKEMMSFIDGLASGSKIVTNSGIHAKLLRFEADLAILEVDQGVKLKFEKSAINLELTKKLNKE